MNNQHKYDRHMEICQELNKIYIDKNKAYGDSFSKAHKELGPIASVVRIYDKVSRIISLVQGAENNVSDENLMDTVRDGANYLIMFFMELEDDAARKTQAVKENV